MLIDVKFPSKHSPKFLCEIIITMVVAKRWLPNYYIYPLHLLVGILCLKKSLPFFPLFIHSSLLFWYSMDSCIHFTSIVLLFIFVITLLENWIVLNLAGGRSLMPIWICHIRDEYLNTSLLFVAQVIPDSLKETFDEHNFLMKFNSSSVPLLYSN